MYLVITSLFSKDLRASFFSELPLLFIGINFKIFFLGCAGPYGSPLAFSSCGVEWSPGSTVQGFSSCGVWAYLPGGLWDVSSPTRD